MLFKKTLKVASATALWMVALLGATSAMAQGATIEADAPPIYSAEMLAASATGMYPVMGDGLETDVAGSSRVIYYLTDDEEETDVFLRIAPTGVLRFTGGPTVTPRTQAPPVNGTPSPVENGTPITGD